MDLSLNTTRGHVEQAAEGEEERNSDEDDGADGTDGTEEENNLSPDMPPGV